jgi:hypothetical protein
MATFDARVFTIPQQMEAANYFVWRQMDAVRNAVSMAGSACFLHSERQGKSGAQLQEMLFQRRGINFDDYPPRFKRGGVVTCVSVEEDFTYIDKRTKEPHTVQGIPRRRWMTEEAPHFSVIPGGFLANQIPSYPPEQGLVATQTLVDQEEFYRALRGEIPLRTSDDEES